MRPHLTFVIAAFLAACSPQDSKSQAGSSLAPMKSSQTAQEQTGSVLHSRVLSEAIEPVVVEHSTSAIPLWRQSRETKPALVLFSYDPFLAPIPEELNSRASDLARKGSSQQIDAHGSMNRSDPLILPTQAVRAALDNGFFSRFVWVFPSKVDPSKLNLGTFRDQMVKAEFLTDTEAASLKLENGVYSGTVRGVPFSAVHPGRLDAIKGPLVLHIDLSFFRGLYDNEVKTPLYDLLYETAVSLRQTGWQPLTTSLSYSILDGVISLDSRFLLSNMAEIFRRPAILDESMPETWRRRAEALYAAELYSDNKKIDLYRTNAAQAPQDATVVFDLFQGHFLAKQIDPALQALDRAALLDKGYAGAYIELAQIALKDGKPEISLTLLAKAAAAYPLNPFIDLQRADLLLQSGRKTEALPIIRHLKSLTWSGTYHADVPALLRDMETFAGNRGGKGEGEKKRSSDRLRSPKE